MALPEDVSELRANLDDYQEQLQQLEELLLDEPENQDYQELYQDVQEAIALTTEALQGHERQGSAAAASTSDAPADGGAAGKKRKSRFDTTGAGAAGALPTQVLSQIRSAKARSALEGHAPMGWAIGFPCMARDSSGRWAAAQVAAVTADGSFTVTWDGDGGETATVHKTDCRPRDTASYKGVNAPTRKAVSEVSKDAYARYLKGEAAAVPAWMQVKEGDSDKQREKKQRALKALKKRMRFEKKDLQSTKQANDWKSFQSGKGSKKKAGVFSSAKRESMFAVPDNPNSKVGVTGSGQGMTNAPGGKRSRLDF